MLKQNGVLLAQMPMRQFGGAIASETRTMWRLSRNMFAGGVSALGGYPNGHTAPSSVMLPQKAGAMSAYTSVVGVGSAAATGALGVNAKGSSNGVAAAFALGQLVASAFGSSSGVGGASAIVTGALFSSGIAPGVGGANANASALGWASGTAAGVGSGVLAAYAAGFMSGTTDSATLLTADDIAAAVHKYVVESGLSFEEITRINHAVLAGKVNGAGTATENFRDVSDSKNRLTVSADEFGNRTMVVADGT